MARKKKRGCLGMILGIGMSAVVVIVLGLVGTYGLKWKSSYEKRNEIPYQKVDLKGKNPAQKYYYESLSEEDKVVYQEILQGVLDGNGEIYLHSAEAKKNNQLFQFVLNDYPEIFWCDGRGKTTIYQKGTESYSVLSPEYQYGQEEREQKQKEIDARTQEVLDGAPKDGAEYEKIQYVYEYVINHTNYREGASDNQNIYSVLVNGESVCAGYARTTQYLLERLNVFCTYVTGTAKRPESSEEVPHAWNLVSCGEDYYYVDTTWGDPVYLEEVDTNIVYDYLCISEEELFQTHKPDDVIALPKCTAKDANYYVLNGMYYETYEKDTILAKMKESIQNKQSQVVFKFANEAVYAEAKEPMLEEMVKEAAEYLGKLYQLSRVKYSYKYEEILHKISIFWSYE